MGFHPGQLVVCVITRNGWRRIFNESVPIRGTVYTVRERIESSGKFGVRLIEIRNPPYQYGDAFAEVAFAESRFRPVDDQRIAIFRSVLTSAPVRDTEPA